MPGKFANSYNFFFRLMQIHWKANSRIGLAYLTLPHFFATYSFFACHLDDDSLYPIFTFMV
jgi:hypothetical protein